MSTKQPTAKRHPLYAVAACVFAVWAAILLIGGAKYIVGYKEASHDIIITSGVVIGMISSVVGCFAAKVIK